MTHIESSTSRFSLLYAALIAATICAYQGQDMAALVALFVGYVSLGRAALLPLSHAFCLLFAAGVSMLAMFAPYHFFEKVSLGEFLREFWIIYFFFLVFGVWGYWQMKREAEETWDLLKANHATASNLTNGRSPFYWAKGYLTWEENEAQPVNAIPVATGIVLARPHRDAIHIPWEHIRELSPSGDRDYTEASLRLNRSFVVRIPWHRSFDDALPASLR